MPATYWPKILEMERVKPGGIANAESVNLNLQLVYGTLDANSQAVGLPWVIIKGIETTHEIDILSIPKTDVKKFIRKHPLFAPGVIPRGYYKSNRDYDIKLLTISN